MKSLNFVNWCNGEVSKSAKIWLSKSIFYVKNHPNLSGFFSLNNNYQFRRTLFCCWHFLITLIFDTLCFLKWCPIVKVSESPIKKIKQLIFLIGLEWFVLLSSDFVCGQKLIGLFLTHIFVLIKNGVKIPH